IQKLEAEREQVAGEHRAHASAKAQLDADIAADEKALAQARTDVEQARGAYGSVAERIGAAQRLASHATTCATAPTEHDNAARALTDARDALAAALETARFDTVEAATIAQRDSAQRSSLEQAIAAADARRATARATLDELADVAIPNETVELDAVESA